VDFEERGIDFREADRRYAELNSQLDAGTISTEEFDAQRKQLMVQDEEGRWWAKSRKTGEWNYYDGNAWVRGIPPGYQPVAEGPPTESAPEHRPQPGQVEPSPSESQVRGGVAGGSAPRRRGALPWVLVAGLVAVTLVGVAAYLLRDGAAMATLPDVVGMSQDEAEVALSSEGFDVKAETRESSENGEGKVVEQSPSGDEAEESSTVAITVGEGPSPGEEALQPAPGYQLVENDAGNLSAEVPFEWSDRYTGYDGTFKGEDVDAGAGVGPAITASTDINAWAAGGPVPGMYMLASRELVREYNEDQLVDSSLNDLFSCDAGERQDFDRPPYSGKIQTWDCRGDGSTIFKLGAAPESRECAIVLQIKTYSEAEREAARHVLDTFEADCERI
jgi:hypothetical protein